jgi:hypothetical protein
MSWASSRPDPDVAEARSVAEGGRPKLIRESGAGQAPSGTSFDADGVPLAVVLGAANIHDTAAFEDLVDAVAPTEADRAYDPKSTRWQQEGGVAYRAAGKVSYPALHSLRCPTRSENCHEKLGLVTTGRLDFPPTVSRYWRKL